MPLPPSSPLPHTLVITHHHVGPFIVASVTSHHHHNSQYPLDDNDDDVVGWCFHTQEDGYTALIQACNNGYLEVVKALVAAGANVNAVDEVGGWGSRGKVDVNIGSFHHHEPCMKCQWRQDHVCSTSS